MSRTTELRDELKSRFYPLVLETGFSLDKGQGPYFRSFRKIDNDKLYVIELQWEKYHRPRFVINFGQCEAKGVEFCGRYLNADEACPVHMAKQGRLYPRKVWLESSLSWFCQDRYFLLRWFGFKNFPASKIVDQAIEAFLELEQFWATGEKSERIRYYPDLHTKG